MKNNIIILSILIFVGSSNAISSPRVDVNRLPLVLIGYAYKVSEDIPRAVENSASRKINDTELDKILGTELSILNDKLEQLSVGIPLGIAFVKYVFISQTNIPEHTSGFPAQNEEALDKPSIPYESILFVTTPIVSFGNKILVVLSNVSPERTRIFTIDTEYKAELLFDTFAKNDSQNTTIGSIHALRVVKPGEFVLEERQGGFSLEHRSFSLKTFSDGIKIQLITK